MDETQRVPKEIASFVAVMRDSKLNRARGEVKRAFLEGGIGCYQSTLTSATFI